MTHQEYEELLSAYIDFEATPEEEKAIREHLESCVSCAELYEQSIILKEKLRGLNEAIPLPPDLNKLLTTPLGKVKKERYIPDLSLGVAVSFALLVILALFTAVYYIKTTESNPLINAVVKSYIDISDGKLPIAYKTENVEDLKVDLDKSGRIPFEFDVDEFSEMGFNLKGALVKNLVNRRSLIFIYQGKEPVGYYLLDSLKSDFPIKAQKIGYKNGTEFYLVQRDGYNMIMWKEEGKTCFMVSRLNPKEFLSLASESVED